MSSFCQNDSLPNKMISFNLGTNIFYPITTSRNVNNYDIYDSPNYYNATIYMQTNVGFHVIISFDRKITSSNSINLYASGGVKYEYANDIISYSDEENYNYSAYTVSGNGKLQWKEQYLSPFVGLNLYNKLGKKMYLVNSLSLNYNFLFYGKKYDKYTGFKNIPVYDSTTNIVSHLTSEYKRDNTLTYSKVKHSQGVTNYQFTGFCTLGIGYLFEKISIGLQIEAPLPIYINSSKLTNEVTLFTPPSDNAISFNRTFYHKAIFSLQLNYYLK